MSDELMLDDHEAAEVAIVGMAGRFPGAAGVEEFWQNLRGGVESISFFTPEELRAEGADASALADPNFVPAKAVLADVESFDAHFFDYNPREAEMLDPQHRVMLECAVEALEDAGYDPEKVVGRVGVYAGVSAGSYLPVNLSSHPELIERVGAYQVDIGNHGEFVPTIISFKLNLKGPSINIQTACSTSLVAVHAACQSLLNGECDIALAGGGSVTFPHKDGHFYQEEGIMSPDGHCRAFDARARGTVSGEGAGLVVLKRLADALADGDTIHAVVKGSAVNNDGSLKIGFTAPSVDGQAEVISEALALAGVDAETITYVETHGTGTALGDPIEVTALTQAFRAATQKRGFCAIGSLKSNIGHLDAGAGVAGLIKTVLALKHKEIPPSLHYETPNPKINFENSPFFVNARLTEWKAGGTRRRAGVSSFGIGGTNAHVILEEAPPDAAAAGETRPAQLLVLSAKTGTALEAATKNLSEYLKTHPEVELADVAYTLQVGRKEFAHRRALVCRDARGAAAALAASDPQGVLTGFQEPRHHPNVFMFPGQGAQHAGMSQGLYEAEPLFREQVDFCAESLLPHLNLDLRGVLYPADGSSEEAEQLLRQTSITQPALFVVEYALARLWMSWGVRPAAMIGHSIGEYVAACLAGVFSLEDALALVAARGRLMQRLPSGLMLAVPLPEKEVTALLPSGLSLAAVNTPNSCVVAGAAEPVTELQGALGRRGIESQLLHTSHAFHSEMMEPALDAFTEQVRRVKLVAPKIPFISNVTGTWISGAEATDPRYWARHMRQTVHFAKGVGELLSESERILIEVGPGRTLSTLAKQHPGKTPNQVILTSMRHPRERGSDVDVLLNALGKFWLAGGRVDWQGVYANERRRRIPLPTYPFERKRYYVEPQGRLPEPKAGRAALRKNEVADWFYLPSWRRVALGGPATQGARRAAKIRWLFFVDGCGLGAETAARLRAEGAEVVTVGAGEHFRKADDNSYTIDPRRPEDYRSLLRALAADRVVPDRVAHLWCVTGGDATPAREEDSAPPSEEEFARAQELGLYSLTFLAQALAQNLPESSLQLLVVTDGVQEVIGDEALRPEKATVLAACRVIPQEHPLIACRSVDVSVPPGGGRREQLVEQLVNELAADTSDVTTAYRGRHRWVQSFEPFATEAADAAGPRLRERGVYMITGGLSGVALVLAEFLAKTVKARLVLTGRGGLPGRDEWDTGLADGGEDGETSYRIRRVRELEALGADVLVLRADVADEGQMRSALASAERQFGALDGVIHGAAANGEGVDKEIAALTPADFERHFEVKARGLLVLEKVLRGRELDFCLTLSSLSSILGGLSFTAYAASNIFADAFVQQRHRRGGDNWMSVNWDAWNLDGEGESARAGKGVAGLWILPREGAEAFGRVLSMPRAPQVVVSTGDLQTRLERWVARAPDAEAVTESQDEAAELHARPELSNTYAAPENELEQEVADIWQELLGIRQVGVHDNFFELGGHSLLATMVISRVRKAFGVELQLRDMFESPTVSGLSLVVADRVIEKHDKQSLAALLEESPGGELSASQNAP